MVIEYKQLTYARASVELKVATEFVEHLKNFLLNFNMNYIGVGDITAPEI